MNHALYAAQREQQQQQQLNLATRRNLQRFAGEACASFAYEPQYHDEVYVCSSICLYCLYCSRATGDTFDISSTWQNLNSTLGIVVQIYHVPFPLPSLFSLLLQPFASALASLLYRQLHCQLITIVSLNCIFVVSPYNRTGFLSTDDMAAPGNLGLYDQIAALRWVKRNIQSFGGNNDDITIMGHDSGAISASLLLLAPHETKGEPH